ncbi:MAG: GtrA family protein [Sphingobium sp.]
MSILKFGLVGLLNTAIGFSIIMVALAVGIGDYAANALGYGAGLTISYVLNRHWTFAVRGPVSPTEILRFIAAFVIAYAANLLVLAVCRGAGLIEQPLVHLAGLALYSMLFYCLTRFCVFGVAPRHWPSTTPRSMLRHTPELLLGLTAGLAFLILRNIPITHDVVWQYWIARQLLGGAILYKDIWEINPPLWFWSAVPIQYATELFHLPPFRLLILVVIGSGAVSSFLVGHLASGFSPVRRAAMMQLAFWLTVILPIYDFGQREQLALICALPYAALIARRYAGLAVPMALAALVGMLAAYGFALKHYFALIPVLLELWLFLRVRREWRPIRPETVILAVCALAYAVSILLFAPAFFTNIVPMVQAAYHGYESSWAMLLARPWVVIWVCIAAYFLVYCRAFRSQAEPMVSAFLIVALSFAIAYFLQRKGWLYHSAPVTGAIALALGVRLGMADLRRVIPLGMGLVLLALPVTLPFLTGQYSNYLRAEIDPILARIPAGEPVFIAAADPMWGWPVLEDHRLVWPSRLYAYWMIPAIAHGEIIGPNPEPLRSLAKQVQDEAALELRCAPPALIIFERRRNYIYQPASFDVRGFFMRKPDIRTFLNENYREITPTRSLYLYRRVKEVRPAHDPACPVIS